jgi:hypothetical protein
MNTDPRSLAIVVLLLAVVLAGRRWGKRFRSLSLSGGREWMFSRGLWSLPTPPVREAFAQAAVLVTPVLAPKMPPGHALLLVPGAVLGLPGLIPILLISLTGGLIIALAQRVASPGVAVLTLAIWLTQAGQMRWRASYMSQTTSGALWLAGWWFLLRWRGDHRKRWLIALAAAAGLGAVTRPLTMLAWAIPVGIVVLHDVIRLRQWKELAAALAVGTVCLMILPIQNRAILGDWRQSPLSLYTRQYIPFDVMGFGLDATEPLIEAPADLRRAMTSFEELHRQHTLRHLPRILATRLNVLWLQTTGQWRQVWVFALLSGLFLLSGPGWFALISGFGLYLAYLLYAHDPSWTAYYAEMTPAVALTCAVGLAWGLARLSGIKTLPLPLALATTLCVLGVGWRDFENTRISRTGAQRPYRRFLERVAATGTQRALVFVRSDDSADPHMSFVRNVADRDDAPIVTAYDFGPARNDSVEARFPGRPAFLWDQRTDQLTPLQRSDSAARAP